MVGGGGGEQVGVRLEQPLRRGGGQDDVGAAQQLLLLLVERLEGGQAGQVAEVGQVGEGVSSLSRPAPGQPQVRGHVLVITAIPILQQQCYHLTDDTLFCRMHNCSTLYVRAWSVCYCERDATLCGWGWSGLAVARHETRGLDTGYLMIPDK